MAKPDTQEILRSNHPALIEDYIDTQPLWGYRFRISQPLGHVAMEVAEMSLLEELEVKAVQIETVDQGALPAHTILDMLVRGISAHSANQHAVRVIAPRFGSGRMIESPIAHVQPLMPEQAMALFDRPDTRIPDIGDEFSVMMNPEIL